MKTREEVEALKASWLKDPNYDIEDTPGFEEYGVELAGFAVDFRDEWEKNRKAQEERDYRNKPACAATLRDMFAAHAIQGELASTEDIWVPERLAVRAYSIADAMMAARKTEATA